MTKRTAESHKPSQTGYGMFQAMFITCNPRIQV